MFDFLISELARDEPARAARVGARGDAALGLALGSSALTAGACAFDTLGKSAAASSFALGFTLGKSGDDFADATTAARFALELRELAAFPAGLTLGRLTSGLSSF